MGIRFHCHHCNHGLHVKDFQAGKRGKCPSCQGSFRIPQRDANFSLSIDELSASDSAIVSPLRSKARQSSSPASSLPNPSSSEPTRANSRSASFATAPASDTSDNATAHPLTTNGVRTQRSDPPLHRSSKAPSPEDALALSLPPSLAPWADARWFIRPPSGGQYGPATTTQLVDWIAERRVTHDSYLWRDGMETWQSAIELVPEPFAELGPGDFPPPQAMQKDPTPSLASSELIREASAGSLASSKAAVSVKRRRQKTQQWLILSLLITLAISLTGILIYILVR